MGRHHRGARVRTLATLARVVGPDGALGLMAAGLVTVGTWARYGWDAAALALGVPLGLFYLYAEIRKLGRAEG